MRNPKRIPKILKLIEKIWLKHPDLRLTQLIAACFDRENIYYVEDDILMSNLLERYCETDTQFKKILKNYKYDPL